MKLVRQFMRMQLLLKNGFCSVKNTHVPYQIVRRKLIKFPYTHFKDTIETDQLIQKESDFLSPYIVEHSFAFLALRQKNASILQYCYFKLFKQQPKQANTTDLNGESIFVRYFTSKLPQIYKALENTENVEEVTYNLKILFYLHILQVPRPQLSTRLEKIAQTGTLAQKAYFLQFYQQKPVYLEFMQNFYKQFFQASDAQKSKAAFVIISISNPTEYLSSTLFSASIKALTKTIQNMDPYEIFHVAERIFDTTYPETKEFAQLCTKKIMKQLSDQHNFKIPIIFKLMKLREKLGMGNESFQNYIKQNPQKFKSIFMKKSINKDHLLVAIASKDLYRLLPADIRIQFATYIFQQLEGFAQSDTSDEDKIVEIFKLILKYYANFNKKEITDLSNILQQKLIPLYQHEKNVLFWMLVILFRINSKLFVRDNLRDLTLDLLEFYDQEYRKSNSDESKRLNLERIIETQSVLYRSHLKFNYKAMLHYDYKHVQNFQSIIYATMVLKAAELTSFQKYTILKSMLPKIETLLLQGKVHSIKNLFFLIGVVEAAKCQQSIADPAFGYIYNALEKGFIQILQHQKNCIEWTSLKYVKTVFSNRVQPQQRSQNQQKQIKSFTSRHFLTLLDECLKKPANFKQSLASYQEKVGNKSLWRKH